MGKPDAPEPADPRVTAGAQTASNVSTAITNQVLGNTNQVTPNGTLSYDQTGTFNMTDPLSGDEYEVPQYTATQTFSPEQQAINDQNNRAGLNLATVGADQSGRLNDLLGRPMGLDSLPERSNPAALNAPNLRESFSRGGPVTDTYGTDFSEDRQRVEDTLMARMNPSLEQDRTALEARLASQGIGIGSEAYQDAMGDFGQQSNDARMAAILGAGQEQSRLTGLEAQRAAFENSAQAQQFSQNAARQGFTNDVRSQEFGMDMARNSAMDAARTNALQEQFAERNQPINEITALMSGAQVQAPNFVNTNAAQMAGTNFAGIQSNYDQGMMANYNARNGQFMDLLGGVGGLMLSDERTKTDISKVGKTDDGQNIYSYRYKAGGPMQMGLMAQEVEKKKPDAVMQVNGLKMVNYGKALS